MENLKVMMHQLSYVLELVKKDAKLTKDDVCQENRYRTCSGVRTRLFLSLQKILDFFNNRKEEQERRGATPSEPTIPEMRYLAREIEEDFSRMPNDDIQLYLDAHLQTEWNVLVPMVNKWVDEVTSHPGCISIK